MISQKQKNSKMDSKKVEKHTKIGRKINPTGITSTSSLLDSYLQDCQQQPPSPASSSTSQTTGDTTFEPSIDMMVNDFDDEQTLTEEEALAELEAQDPADEIETLHKESEMPLEMLLAHYRQQVENDCQEEEEEQSQSQKRHKRKKSTKKHKQSRSKHHHHQHHHHLSKSGGKPATTEEGAASASSPTNQHSNNADKVQSTSQEPSANNDEVIVIEESEDEIEILKTEQADTDAGEDGGSSNQDNEQEEEANVDEDDGDDEDEAEFDDCSFEGPTEQTKLTALALLYPDKYAHIHDEKMDDDCSDDDEDDDDDYVKKTIMVGAAYQATIPVGLSKYGDVLPYENEDKLVWEASQVSEPEVEDYLIRVKEIKSSPNLPGQDDEIPSSSASVTSESDPGVGSSTVKDDEQALHLLVQCGYNFKEALRRRRLNAVPLTGTMSIWSEEECRNFEEGIQKFGKDFRKIRQFQVRTRSIRELVQFYYLWKKTERRDQDFVDSDTIDHMDAYLDFDERDTASNNGNASKPATSSCLLTNYSYLTTSEPPSKRHHHSNFSIMNETNRSSSSANNHLNSSNSKKSKKTHRRRSSSSCLLSGTKSKHHDSSSETIFTKTSSVAVPATTTTTEEAPSLPPASPSSSVKNWRTKNSSANSPSSSTHTTGVSLATNLQANNLKQK